MLRSTVPFEGALGFDYPDFGGVDRRPQGVEVPLDSGDPTPGDPTPGDPTPGGRNGCLAGGHLPGVEVVVRADPVALRGLPAALPGVGEGTLSIGEGGALAL
jgi:hypothetical protein